MSRRRAFRRRHRQSAAAQQRDARRLRARLGLEAADGRGGDRRRGYDAAQRWDSEPVHVGSRTIHDSHPVGRALTVPEVLSHSSNTATARIADQMGSARMQGLWRSLHFNERMPIELRERAGTIMPRPTNAGGDWARGDVMSTGFGHAIAVTPLHLAASYAALVNGGIWRPTTLLRRTGAPPQGERVFTAETSHKMRQMLRLIVTDGTGRNADVPRPAPRRQDRHRRKGRRQRHFAQASTCRPSSAPSRWTRRATSSW